jgi:curved DNA-binding protein CbpA
VFINLKMMEQLSESPEKAALSNSPIFPEKPIIDSEEIEHDYYAILEMPSTASNEYIGGSYNRIFNRLTALQHSHDGPQAPETVQKFKDLEEAYQTLSNPVKRKVYDNRNRVQQQPESIINQTYKAIVSRLRSPSISIVGGGIAAEVIENVVQICQGGIEGVDTPLDPRVVDMVWGTTIDGRVDRQTACYYRISISNENLSNGFLMNCKSSNKDRFKLVMFDSSGKLLHLEDSTRSKDRQSTEATLLFTLFNTGNQVKSDSVNEKILSSPFFLSEKLESIVSYERVVPPGDFLICIYGDNMIGKANFNLIAVPANNDATEVMLTDYT